MTHLNDRQRSIVRLVAAASGPVTGAEIARELGVSVRTVQSEVAQINHAEQLLRSGKNGYVLSPAAERTALLAEPAPATQDDVLRAIVPGLLLDDGNLTVDDVAERLYVSSRTVERRLGVVREALAPHGLRLDRHQGRLSLEGDETARRRFLADLVVREIAEGERSDASQGEGSLLDLLAVGDVRRAIALAVHEASYYVEPGYETGLAANCAIALFRLRAEETSLPSVPSDTEPARQIARAVCAAYASRTPVAVADDDLDYLSTLLGHAIRPVDGSREGEPRLEEAFLSQVEAVVREACAPFGISVERNKAMLSFALHVRQLLRRADDAQFLGGDTLAGIKRSYPFVFEISQLVADGLERRFSMALNATELGFVCLHMGMVIGETERDRLRMALMAAPYREVTNSLRDRLVAQFGEQADVIVVESGTSLGSVGRLDLVVTTGQPPCVPLPCVQVSPFLITDDVLHVQRALVQCLETRRARATQATRRFFSPTLFFKTDELADRDAVIDFLSERLVEQGVVGDWFGESVRVREAAGSSCFFESFAIPHALRMEAARTTFGVLVSEKGVLWGDVRIHVALMIAVCAEDRAQFMGLFDTVVKALSSRSVAAEAARAETLDEFLGVVFGA